MLDSHTVCSKKMVCFERNYLSLHSKEKKRLGRRKQSDLSKIVQETMVELGLCYISQVLCNFTMLHCPWRAVQTSETLCPVVVPLIVPALWQLQT